MSYMSLSGALIISAASAHSQLIVYKAKAKGIIWLNLNWGLI